MYIYCHYPNNPNISQPSLGQPWVVPGIPGIPGVLRHRQHRARHGGAGSGAGAGCGGGEVVSWLVILDVFGIFNLWDSNGFNV